MERKQPLASTLEDDVVPVRARSGSAGEDVDGDGRLDTVLRFRTQDLGIEPGDTSATVAGRATDRGAVHGRDTFRTVG